MLYREIMAVCSEIHKKHKYSRVGKTHNLCTLNLVVRIVITGVSRAKNTRNHTPSPPLMFVVQCLIKHRGTFTFTHDLSTSVHSNGTEQLYVSQYRQSRITTQLQSEIPF